MTTIKFEHCRVCRARFTGKEEMSQLGQHILREHPVDAWKAYAEIYLDRMWFGQDEQDKRFVKEFESTITVEKLHHMFGKYNLSRNFVNGVCGHGPARLQRFADMLNGYRDKEITKKEFPDIVESELENMREAYGFEPLSAITKSFWMMHQHPVVIRDTLALEGLNRRGLGPGSRYRTYFAAWFKFFDDPGTQKGLDEAIEWLPESPAAHGIIETARADGAKQGESAAEEKVQAVRLEIGELAAKQLMRNRIVDMRLLYEGGGFLEDSRTACRTTENNKLAAA